MKELCKEEGVPPERVFFAFLSCWFYRYELSQYKFFVCEGQVIFSGDQEKNHVEFFDAGILRV